MELLGRGGPFMWALLLISLITLWAILERSFYFLGAHRGEHPGLNNGSNSDPGDNAEAEARRVLQAAESRTWLLGLAGRIAPLVGLLGTVSGLIRVFVEMETGGDFGIEQLASGVWEALLTTAAGLAIAIPALAGYGYFNRLVERTRDELEAWLDRVEAGQ